MVKDKNNDAVLSDWDISEHLKSEKDIKRFLNVALEENDPELFELALGLVAKARLRMAKENNDVAIPRATLYRQLSGNGTLTVANLFKILNKLNIRLVTA